jgi:2-desacetyl-2-hydroxyethyl bacteriochlorophyllide A dehydrogenase
MDKGELVESLNIVFTGKDQVEVRRAPLGRLESGQILVESKCSLISTGTEGIVLGRKFAPGTHWDNWVKYPFTPGYNNAGQVIEVAPDVAHWKVGDRIASRTSHSQFNVRHVGASGPSGPAVNESGRTSPIPDGVSDEEAAWFGMACIAQVGVRGANHAMGDAVVIVGMGIVGQLVLQYVRALGARDIIVIDTAEPRLEMARAHGATQTLNISVAEAHDAVFDLTQGKGADVVYDVTGHPAVFSPALGLARRFGTLLLLGDAGTPSEQRLTSDVITRGVRIIGVHDGHIASQASDHDRWTHEAMTDLFFSFLQRDQMRVRDLITHRYAPQDAPAAYNLLQTNRDAAMGVVFDWSQAS